MRELARDGQAYVIHNRVESIFEFASRIKKLLPQARVVVGHGQMDGEELDDVFHAFKSGRADILVATSIVEKGIDIPNANTILIDRADRFGLADLYQLRWTCWTLESKSLLLLNGSKNAVFARNQSKAPSSTARDKWIRRRHEVGHARLGNSWSGRYSGDRAIRPCIRHWIHLYCKMLRRTIQALQGDISSVLVDTKIEMPIDARLPEDYVNETSLRMEIYQRLGEALSWEEVTDLWND